MKESKCMLLGAMGIFGTVGIFVRYIPLASGLVALVRAVLGILFLLGILVLSGRSFDRSAIRENILLLCLSGAAMGFNWVLLFESYHYTSVATATVCYYLAPVFLILASPLLGEKLTPKKLFCIAVALLGLIFVSGITEGGIPALSELKGIGLALGAAALYATVMLLNKKLTPIPAYDKTILQLAAAAAVLLPYLLFSGGMDFSGVTPLTCILLAVVGIVHTGVAYALYFGSMESLQAQTIAIFSYLDPVIAVLLSALVLRESLTGWGIAGTVLILGSALFSELNN